MNRLEDMDGQIFPSPPQRGKKGKRLAGPGQAMDTMMPPSDVINLELMTNFGGKELSAQFETQH